MPIDQDTDEGLGPRINCIRTREVFFLQGQGDQVAESALGQGVLVGEQSIVRTQCQLPGTRTGITDNCSP